MEQGLEGMQGQENFVYPKRKTSAFMEYNGTDLLDKNGNTHDIEDNCRNKVSE